MTGGGGGPRGLPPFFNMKAHPLSLGQYALPLFAGAALAAVPTPTPAQGMPVWLGPVSKGSETIIHKPVRSWKAMKFTNVVRQQTDFSCGAAALATIFNFAYGKDATEQQVLVNMMKVADPEIVRDKGFSLLDMKNYVAAVGMTGEGFKVDYDALQHLKVPGIVLLNIKNYKHFVVVRKAADDVIHIADPALGNRIMSRGAFEDSWNGIVFVVLGEGYDPETVLRNPPPPLSARQLFGQRSPVPNAEPYDFGLLNAVTFGF